MSCYPCNECCRPICPAPTPKANFYAQFGVNANPPSGNNLPLFTVFNKGNQIVVDSSGTIILPGGYLYHIDYLFQATPEIGSYFQIVPHINNSPGLLYSFLSQAAVYRSSSASGGFLTDQALTQDASLRFVLTYPPETRNIDISGAVSIMPLPAFYSNANN